MPSGDAFRISDLDRLENETLPAFFRHQRFQSLVRQLNFYNFRKINRERTFWIYRHPLFHRDHSESLHLLRRRTCPGLDGRRTRHDMSNDKFDATTNNTGGTSSPEDSDVDTTTSEEPPLKKVRATVTMASHRKPISRQQMSPPATPATRIVDHDHSGPEDGRTFTPFIHAHNRSFPKGNATPFMVSESESPKLESPTADYFSAIPSSQISSDQTTLLSKLSRKLEEHIKRANIAASVNKLSRRGGKRRMGVVTPPHSDTMKYNALTYDDDGDWLSTSIDGNSCSIGKNSDKRNHRYNHDSISVNSFECSSQRSDDSLNFIQLPSPALDRNIDTEMKEKIHSWVDHGSFSTTDNRELLSSVICFCLSTTPDDPNLRDKALDHMKFHDGFSLEFQRYKAALLGTDFSFFEKQLVPDHLFLGRSESMDTTRTFKVFIINYLRNIIREQNIWKDVNFTHHEALLFQNNVKIWVDGTLSS